MTINIHYHLLQNPGIVMTDLENSNVIIIKRLRKRYKTFGVHSSWIGLQK